MQNDDLRSPFAKPVAIVTGAAGGMGQACARRLTNTHTLVLTDFNAGRLAATTATLREEDNADIAAELCGDIADDGLIKRVVDAATETGGECRVLVHTAGLSPALAGWAPIIKTNLIGTAKLLAAVEPLLTPGFVGVLLASTARCFVPPPHEALANLLASPLADDLMEQLGQHLGSDDSSRGANAYAYSKAWIYETVKQRATEWAAKGARIVSLSPGFIRTGMTRTEVIERPEIRTLLESTPIGRWGTVNDVANLVEFVISDKASFITGTDIVLDGGLSARILTRN